MGDGFEYFISLRILQHKQSALIAVLETGFSMQHMPAKCIPSKSKLASLRQVDFAGITQVICCMKNYGFFHKHSFLTVYVSECLCTELSAFYLIYVSNESQLKGVRQSRRPFALFKLHLCCWLSGNYFILSFIFAFLLLPSVDSAVMVTLFPFPALMQL